jgi:hypothetical protein
MDPGDPIFGIALDDLAAGVRAGFVHGNVEAVREFSFDEIARH